MIELWRDSFDRDAAAFADLLAATDPATPVTTCPGWTLADLATHLGAVHRWAQASMGTPAEGPPPSDDFGPGDADLHPWFVEGAAALGADLRSVDGQQPCWGFGPKPRTAEFWVRRQAHETAMHRWDAEHAAGRAPSYDAALAGDGIDEVVATFLPRQLRLRRIEPFPEVVHLLADGTTYAIGEGSPDATVTGSADAVLTLLWRRTTADDERLTIDGDRAALDRVLGLAIVP